MKCIIGTGSRDYRNPKPIRDVFIRLIAEFGIFKYRHGNARGFDKLSEYIARELKLQDILTYNADWNQYGRSAGPLRNMFMLDSEMIKETDILVIAFPLANSIGTWHMVEYTRSKLLQVRIFNEEGIPQ